MTRAEKKLRAAMLEKINPGKKIKGAWKNVLVEHDCGLPDTLELYYTAHEIYFDKKGDFLGISTEPKQMITESIEDYITMLENVLKDIAGNPHITQKEFELL